jgi:hypothetical protein
MKNRPSNWQIKFGGISGFLLLVFLVWRDVFRHAFGGQIALAGHACYVGTAPQGQKEQITKTTLASRVSRKCL